MTVFLFACLYLIGSATTILVIKWFDWHRYDPPVRFVITIFWPITAVIGLIVLGLSKLDDGAETVVAKLRARQTKKD